MLTTGTAVIVPASSLVSSSFMNRVTAAIDEYSHAVDAADQRQPRPVARLAVRLERRDARAPRAARARSAIAVARSCRLLDHLGNMRRRPLRPREVARGDVASTDAGRERRILRRAERLLRDRAARMEAAAGRQVDRARRIADDARPPPRRARARAAAPRAAAPACTDAARSRTARPSAPPRRSGRGTSPRRGRRRAARPPCCARSAASVRPSFSRSSSSRFSTVACTETSSAETGSSAIEQLRLERERARDRHALALAARELPRMRVERPRPEPDQVEQLAAARVDRRLRHHLVRAQQLRQRLPHRHPRVERRVRILEHHLDPPALAPLALRGQRLALVADRPRRSGRRARRCSGRASTCRSPTRRRGRASRRVAIVEVDAVDRPQDLRLGRPRSRRPSPPRSAKCTCRPSQLEQRLSHSAITGSRRTSSGDLVVVQAARRAVAAELEQRDRALEAVVLHERAARMEAAARRRRREIRRRARDRRERARARRRSRAPSAAGRACTDAAARGRRPSTAPVSTIWPAYITATRRQVCAITARSCETKTSATSSSSLQLLQQLQDLILDRHVERRRRLVAEDQLRLCRRARSRSSRAGASRPTARAGTPRRAAPDRGCRPAASARAPAPSPARRDCPSRTSGSSAICSPTRITGLSAVIGSWKIIDDGRAAQLAPPVLARRA